MNNKAVYLRNKMADQLMFASTEGKDISVRIHHNQFLVTLQMNVTVCIAPLNKVNYKAKITLHHVRSYRAIASYIYTEAELDCVGSTLCGNLYRFLPSRTFNIQ